MVVCVMPKPIPPRSVKENQHYVPRSWISRFAGENGRLVGLKDGTIQHQVNVADIMSEDWLYTIFDEWWRPSDRIEDALAEVEGGAKDLFDALTASRSLPTDKQWVELCRFLALTACRHPDTMQRGHQRAKEMAWALADADTHPDAASFFADIRSRFGVDLPYDTYGQLLAQGLPDLIAEAENIQSMTPWDPRLPEEISLEAVDFVAKRIITCNLILLDAPPGANYVLSDRPMPAKDALVGFTVPLSRSLAFLALPTTEQEDIALVRRDATPEQVGWVNKEQKQRAKSIIVGPDKETLSAL